jgi:predicted DNA-binding transcriptional regulator AlpA
MQEEKHQHHGHGRLVRLAGLRELYPVSRQQIYLQMKRPIDPFPAPMRIAGGSASFWREDDVLAWLERNLSVEVR